MTVPSGRKRIGLDGRVLRPEETVSPAAYRPEGKGRGLHAILERAESGEMITSLIPRPTVWRSCSVDPSIGPSGPTSETIPTLIGPTMLAHSSVRELTILGSGPS